MSTHVRSSICTKYENDVISLSEKLILFIYALCHFREHFHQQGPEVIKLFPSSTQLSTKFQLLIKTKIQKSEEISRFKSLRCGIYHAH